MDLKIIKMAATALGIVAVIGTVVAVNYNQEKQATWTKSTQKQTVVESQSSNPKPAEVTPTNIQPTNVSDNTESEHEQEEHHSKKHDRD